MRWEVRKRRHNLRAKGHGASDQGDTEDASGYITGSVDVVKQWKNRYDVSMG